jgi:hypothetical protein
MIGPAVKNLHMDIAGDVIHEAAEEIGHELRLQVADETHLQLILVNQSRTAAQVDRHHGESFIHGKNKIAGAVDSFTLSQRFSEELAKHDADIFNGMVLIDIQISVRVERQIEAAMFREQFEHVVEEPDSGRNLVTAATFDPK